MLRLHRIVVMFDLCLQVTFLIIDEVPDPKEDWVKKNIASWMSDPIVWHRESYQRDYAASKIQSKHKGKKYVVLCSDVDEIPNRDFVTELSTQQGYEQAHEACYMAMNFSYYNFHWASPQDWWVSFPLHVQSPVQARNCNFPARIIACIVAEVSLPSEPLTGGPHTLQPLLEQVHVLSAYLVLPPQPHSKRSL